MARFRGFNTYLEWERGFRGWLVFFFLSACLSALGEAYLLFQRGRVLAALSRAGAFRTPLAVELCLTLVAAATFVGIVYGLGLFVHEDERTPAFWTGFFLVTIPVSAAVAMLDVYLTRGYARTSLVQALLAALRRRELVTLALKALWVLYWMRSDRVRRTYGHAGFRRAPTEPAAQPQTI